MTDSLCEDTGRTSHEDRVRGAATCARAREHGDDQPHQAREAPGTGSPSQPSRKQPLALQVSHPGSSTVGVNVCCPSPVRGAVTAAWERMPYPQSQQKHLPAVQCAHTHTHTPGQAPRVYSSRMSSVGGSHFPENPESHQRPEPGPHDPAPHLLHPGLPSSPGYCTHPVPGTVFPRFLSWSVPSFKSQPKPRLLRGDFSTHHSADMAPSLSIPTAPLHH